MAFGLELNFFGLRFGTTVLFQMKNDVQINCVSSLDVCICPNLRIYISIDRISHTIIYISTDKISRMTSLKVMIVCMSTDVPNLKPRILPNPHPSPQILTFTLTQP
jgi:hypothetical protein